MIRYTIELVNNIATQRGIDLRVVHQILEIKTLQSFLIPIYNVENKYFGVWSTKKNIYFRGGLLNDPIFFKGKFFNLYPFDFQNIQKCATEVKIFKPTIGGLTASFGTGDRLGLSTAAHLDAFKKYNYFPIIAQQSPRELEKTDRSFQSVLVDAVWGVFVSGYKGKFGADADHIKDEFRLHEAIESGFSFYTLDVSETMGKNIASGYKKGLNEAHSKLLYPQLEVYKRYLGRNINLSSGFQIKYDEKNLKSIILTYLPVIDYVEYMNDVLKKSLVSYDLEISLDESNVATSFEAHFFVAEEIHRRGIDFQSLALKFPGYFEKGINFRGDIKKFEDSLIGQAAIVRNIGGYRLSLHSGSDKFSIYPIFSQKTEGLFHVKTSGTSWLKALETIAVTNPELFRRIYSLSIEKFQENKKAYQISLDVKSLPKNLESISNEKLLDLMKNDFFRQLLHISYGSILHCYRKDLFQTLFQNEKDLFNRVKENIENHLKELDACQIMK